MCYLQLWFIFLLPKHIFFRIFFYYGGKYHTKKNKQKISFLVWNHQFFSLHQTWHILFTLNQTEIILFFQTINQLPHITTNRFFPKVHFFLRIILFPNSFCNSSYNLHYLNKTQRQKDNGDYFDHPKNQPKHSLIH